MQAPQQVLGYHTVLDTRVRLSNEKGRALLQAFMSHGYCSVYGEVLRTIDKHLGHLPFRPLIEVSGCDVFADPGNKSWIFCKVPERWEAIQIEGHRHYLEFVIVGEGQDTEALGVLRSICKEHLGATLHNGLLREAYAHQAMMDQCSGTSHSGELLSQPSVKEYFRQKYASGLTEEEKRGPTEKYPKGLWLESMVADAFEAIDIQAQRGLQAGIDEVDIFVSPFGYDCLVECKDSNLQGKEVAFAKAKAERLGIRNVLMIVTDSNIHPNLGKDVSIWDEANLPSLSAPMPNPQVSAYVLRDFSELKRFLDHLAMWSKLDLLGEWIQLEDSRPLIPWFSSKNTWGETVSHASAWYSSVAEDDLDKG